MDLSIEKWTRWLGTGPINSIKLACTCIGLCFCYFGKGFSGFSVNWREDWKCHLWLTEFDPPLQCTVCPDDEILSLYVLVRGKNGVFRVEMFACSTFCPQLLLGLWTTCTDISGILEGLWVS